MTASAPAYPNMGQGPYQQPPPFNKQDIEMGSKPVATQVYPVLTTNVRSKSPALGCVYIALMIYASISIFFSLIFGIIGISLASYAWYCYKHYDNPVASVVNAVLSFIFSTVSYLVPVIFYLLWSQGVITTAIISY